MLDIFNLPPKSQADVQTFPNGGQWATWVKPKGASMAYLLAIGAGGGGGGGVAAYGGSAGCGAGGGSGAISRLLVPVLLLPDVLYVLTGAGGPGGTGSSTSSTLSTTVGVAGGSSIIATSKTQSTATNQILVANGGLGALQTVGGGQSTGGAGGSASTASGVLGVVGLFSSTAGQSGGSTGAYSSSATTTPVQAWTTLPITGGAAGAAYAGQSTTLPGAGVVTGPAVDWCPAYYVSGAVLAPGGAAVSGTSLAPNPGSQGATLSKPFASFGGAGAGSAEAGGPYTTNPTGGAGGVGSGGGGGSGSYANTSPVVGAFSGGAGGNGLVITVSW